MRALLDTCALIWFVEDNQRALSASLMDLIEDDANDIFVSLASIWELAIKLGTGKLTLQQPLDPTFRDKLVDQGFQILDITFAHVTAVQHLPPVHRDPFDRLMIAQCREEQLVAITGDPHWSDPAYGIQTLWE